MNKQTLKPCPFCGGTESLWGNYKAIIHKIDCIIFDINGFTTKKAIQSWNRRFKTSATTPTK